MIKGIKISEKNDIMLDLLRVLACLCVIGIHTPPGSVLFSRVAVLGLPMFFLLTGYFLLPRCNGDEVLSFYKDRFEKIVIPFICYGLFYRCWIYPAGKMICVPNKGIILFGLKYIPTALLQNFNGPVYFHFWFMYELIALYLIFPFLGQGLKALSDKALRNLLILMVVTQALVDYLPVVGVEFPFQHYFGWMMYAIFGYAFTREFLQKKYKTFAIVGGIVFVLQLAVYKFLPEFADKVQHSSDLNPWMILPVCGWFAIMQMLSLKFYGSREGKPASKGYEVARHIIGFLAAYTFSVYMMQGYIISWWNESCQLVALQAANIHVWDFVTIFSVFGMCLVFAFFYDNIVVALVKKIYCLIASKI